MSVDERFQRANAALLQGRWEEAEAAYRDLIAVQPMGAYANLGALYDKQCRLEEADEAYRQARRIDPSALGPAYGQGLLRLRQGRYAEGWRLFEARRGLPVLRTPDVALGCPEWRGEDLAGKRLLVIAEQGLGDQIQFARFLPELARRGADVAFACDPAVAPLCAGLGVQALPWSAGRPLPDADYWVLLLSLPLRLGVTLETLDGRPYLSAAPRGSGGVGVKALGSPAQMHDRFRSLPPDQAARLERLGVSLEPEATGARDLKDTAEIVAGLDLVITVCTSVAHLAGALGKPVWILLAAQGVCWRWLHGRADTPWYDSAVLYRQRTPGDWVEVLDRVEADLAARPAPRPRGAS